MRRLLVTVNIVPNSPILVAVMMEVIRSTESSVITKAKRSNITEDGILHSHRHEILKTYISPPAPGFLRVKGNHIGVALESLMVSLSMVLPWNHSRSASP
jgi:hypothetical protein